MSSGIVYVLVNEAFDSYVKIGKTTNLKQRLQSLDNTSVPLPFRCVYAIQVDDMDKIEKLAHGAFADHRTRSNREFFEIDPQRVISALQMTGGIEVTPKEDIAADDEGLSALKKTSSKRKRLNLYQANLKEGDILTFSRNEAKTAEVISAKKVLFDGTEESLSSSALKLLHADGYQWPTVNGWQFWMFDGETIAERLDRILESAEEE